MLPLVAAVALAAWSVVAASAADEQAGAAAEAGAVALVQDADPLAAARAALPKGVEGRVRVTGRRVRVHVEPKLPLPVLSGLLAADAEADAGPKPAS